MFRYSVLSILGEHKFVAGDWSKQQLQDIHSVFYDKEIDVVVKDTLELSFEVAKIFPDMEYGFLNKDYDTVKGDLIALSEVNAKISPNIDLFGTNTIPSIQDNYQYNRMKQMNSCYGNDSTPISEISPGYAAGTVSYSNINEPGCADEVGAAWDDDDDPRYAVFYDDSNVYVPNPDGSNAIKQPDARIVRINEPGCADEVGAAWDDDDDPRYAVFYDDSNDYVPNPDDITAIKRLGARIVQINEDNTQNISIETMKSMTNPIPNGDILSSGQLNNCISGYDDPTTQLHHAFKQDNTVYNCFRENVRNPNVCSNSLKSTDRYIVAYNKKYHVAKIVDANAVSGFRAIMPEFEMISIPTAKVEMCREYIESTTFEDAAAVAAYIASATKLPTRANLKRYIEKNYELSETATTDFEKELQEVTRRYNATIVLKQMGVLRGGLIYLRAKAAEPNIGLLVFNECVRTNDRSVLEKKLKEREYELEPANCAMQYVIDTYGKNSWTDAEQSVYEYIRKHNLGAGYPVYSVVDELRRLNVMKTITSGVSVDDIVAKCRELYVLSDFKILPEEYVREKVLEHAQTSVNGTEVKQTNVVDEYVRKKLTEHERETIKNLIMQQMNDFENYHFNFLVDSEQHIYNYIEKHNIQEIDQNYIINIFVNEFRRLIHIKQNIQDDVSLGTDVNFCNYYKNGNFVILPEDYVREKAMDNVQKIVNEKEADVADVVAVLMRKRACKRESIKNKYYHRTDAERLVCEYMLIHDITSGGGDDIIAYVGDVRRLDDMLSITRGASVDEIIAKCRELYALSDFEILSEEYVREKELEHAQKIMKINKILEAICSGHSTPDFGLIKNEFLKYLELNPTQKYLKNVGLARIEHDEFESKFETSGITEKAEATRVKNIINHKNKNVKVFASDGGTKQLTKSDFLNIYCLNGKIDDGVEDCFYDYIAKYNIQASERECAVNKFINELQKMNNMKSSVDNLSNFYKLFAMSNFVILPVEYVQEKVMGDATC